MSGPCQFLFDFSRLKKNPVATDLLDGDLPASQCETRFWGGNSRPNPKLLPDLIKNHCRFQRKLNLKDFLQFCANTTWRIEMSKKKQTMWTTWDASLFLFSIHCVWDFLKKVMAVIDAKNDDNAVEIPLGATQAESGDSRVSGGKACCNHLRNISRVDVMMMMINIIRSVSVCMNVLKTKTKNTHIHKYKYTNIQINKCANTQIHMHEYKYKYTNTNKQKEGSSEGILACQSHISQVYIR